MPTYSFLARDHAGAAQQGVLVAASHAEAVKRLRGEGRFVVQLREAADVGRVADAQPLAWGGRVKVDEVIFFAMQLSVMIETGVSISDALTSLIDSAPPGRFRDVLEDLRSQVQSGREFSIALAAHTRVFPPLLINMVRASEASGTLGPMLRRAADYLRKQRETRRKVRGAMIYPAVVLVMAVGVVIFMMTVVLPKFTPIYAGREALLPLPTRVVMAISAWMIDWWWLWGSGLVLALTTIFILPRTRRGRPITDLTLLRLPIIGRMVHKAALTRGLRTLGTLVSAGVSMLETVALTRRLSGNILFERLWTRVEEHLHRGEQLSDPLAGSRLVPLYVVQMVRAGEKSGQLGPVLDTIADFLENDLNQAIKNATGMIEPLMIGVMGVIVGGISIAMLLPIFTLSRVIAH